MVFDCRCLNVVVVVVVVVVVFFFIVFIIVAIIGCYCCPCGYQLLSSVPVVA